MKQLILTLAAMAALTTAAYAQNFVSAYAPREGERATISVERCRSDDAGQNLERQCARLSYRETVLAPAAGGAPRISYVLQSMTLPEGQQLNEAQLREAGLSMTMIFQTDEGGSPVRVENRAEVMNTMFATLARLSGGDGDPASQQAARALFERMDDAGFAYLVGRDIVPLTIFQAVDGNVGEPVTGQMEMAFPLDPSQNLLVNATLLITAIDHDAGIARATYTQVTDEASAAAALRGFALQLPEDRRPDFSSMRVNVRDQALGVMDLVSGRTLEVVYTKTIEVSVGDQRQLRVERVTVRRRML